MIRLAEKTDLDIVARQTRDLYIECFGEEAQTDLESYKKMTESDYHNKFIFIYGNHKAFFTMARKEDLGRKTPLYWEGDKVFIEKRYRKSVIYGRIYYYIKDTFEGRVEINTLESSPSSEMLQKKFIKVSTTRILKDD